MDKKSLIEAAFKVRLQAYAPYSNFAVGAALLTKSGQVFVGCNVENISLGLTTCAEQGAVSAAVAAGDKDFVAMVVVADSKEPAFPCGRCRQVMAEFDQDLEITTSTLNGKIETFRLSDVLPKAKQGILE